MLSLFLTAYFLLFETAVVQSRSTGAPTSACSNITPGHGGLSGTLPGGFYLYSNLIDCGGNYIANQAYTIRLQGSEQFRGFLIQARQSGTTTPIGSFTSIPSGTKTLSCSGVATASVTHSNSNLKTSVEFTWTAPSTSGTVEFRYAVVVQNSGGINEYYANINAADYRPSSLTSCPSVASSTFTTSTVAPSDTSITPTADSSTTVALSNTLDVISSSTTVSSTSDSVGTSSSSVSIYAITPTVIPTSSPVPSCYSTDKTPSSSFPITFKTPADCDRESCDFYWAMGGNTYNSEYLDVYMEGNAAGWIGVGFSQNQMMGMTDVLGCRVDSGTITVVDSWNPSGYSPNVQDSNSSGICHHSSSYSNGRISCLFSRYAGISNPGQDFNLNNALYIIRAYRKEAQSNVDRLNKHTDTPAISTQQYNPLRDSNRVNLTAATIQCPNAPAGDVWYPENVTSPSGDYFFGVRINSENSSFVDIKLEGTAEGWVAVGFSKTSSMFGTDVLACKRDSNSDIVYAIDGWNPESPTRTNNIDDTQVGMCQHVTAYSNGKISCIFSRYIGIVNDGQDLNLNQDLYRIYNASSPLRGSSPGVTSLPVHSTRKPSPTTTKSNLVERLRLQSPLTCPNAPLSNSSFLTNFTSQDGTYFFGARINSENNQFLDIKLEGTATGWIAVGFSKTSSMFSSDVLACKRDPNSDIVYAIDGWNPESPTRTNNIDDTQVGMCQHMTAYSNGKISCIFSRYIGALNDGQDLSIDQDLYRIYNAYSDQGGLNTASLSIHSARPSLTENSNNLLTLIMNNTGETAIASWPKKQIIQTHGIFMISAWILLASSAIFFAAWMKPVLPNGEWFQVHRAFMIVSLFIGAAGFIFAFIANAKVKYQASLELLSKNITHFVFGVIIMCLHIANPIISIFRCKPTGGRRWIFNLVHAHIIGYLALILAIVNIGIGISLFEGQGNYRILWFYVAFIILLVAFFVALFIIYTINAYRAPESDRSVLVHSLLKYKFLCSRAPDDDAGKKDTEMMSKDEKEEKETSPEKPQRKEPIKSAPVVIGWITSIIHLLAVIIAVLVLIVWIGAR